MITQWETILGNQYVIPVGGANLGYSDTVGHGHLHKRQETKQWGQVKCPLGSFPTNSLLSKPWQKMYYYSVVRGPASAITNELTQRNLLTSDQSRATHCGGQDWLLQGSFSTGRCVKQLPASSVSSSEGPIFLMQRTVRERIPPSQVLLHSDQSPINHLDRKC